MLVVSFFQGGSGGRFFHYHKLAQASGCRGPGESGGKRNTFLSGALDEFWPEFFWSNDLIKIYGNNCHIMYLRAGSKKKLDLSLCKLAEAKKFNCHWEEI
jgi:hypothetical protein